MGLLDEMLGQLTGTVGQRGALRPEATQSGAGGGMGPILMALMPIVIGMLRNSGQAPAAGVGRASTGGGLGDILGQVLGGGGGAGAGGLGGLLEHLQRAGFGEQARSWVGTGDNQPVSPADMSQIFGAGGLSEIARRAGLGEDDTARGLSQLMPEVVNHLTPQGRVPENADLLAGVDSFAKRLGIS
jgi:uncharacterized protein YidB (DUF937 family)